MPDWLQTAAAMRDRGHRMPVVLMSGYAAEEFVRDGEAAPVDGFVKKPFGTAELREALAAVLAGEAGTALC